MTTECGRALLLAFQLVLPAQRTPFRSGAQCAVPALAQIPDRRERQGAAVLRAGTVLALAGGAGAAALVASLFPIEEILWGKVGDGGAGDDAARIGGTRAGDPIRRRAATQSSCPFRRWTAVITIRAPAGSALVCTGGGAPCSAIPLPPRGICGGDRRSSSLSKRSSVTSSAAASALIGRYLGDHASDLGVLVAGWLGVVGSCRVGTWTPGWLRRCPQGMVVVLAIAVGAVLWRPQPLTVDRRPATVDR